MMKASKVLCIFIMVLMIVVLLSGCNKIKQAIGGEHQQTTSPIIKRYPIFVYEQSKNLWGYMNERGKIVINPQYEYATDFSKKNGIAIVYIHIPEHIYYFGEQPVESGMINTSGKYIQT